MPTLVGAPGDPDPDKILGDCKAYGSRRPKQLWSRWDAVILRRRYIRDGIKVLLEIFAAAGAGFTSQVVHRLQDGQLLTSGTGEELADRVTLGKGEGFDAVLQRVGKFDRQCAHGRDRIKFKKSPGAMGVTPSCSAPRKSREL